MTGWKGSENIVKTVLEKEGERGEGEKKWTPAGGVVGMIHIRGTFIGIQGMQGVLVRLPPSLC